MINKYIENIKTFSFIVFFLLSCGEVKRVDTKAVKEHISDYKIKKADQSTIVLQAETWSQSLADSLERRITKQLQRVTSKTEITRICALRSDPWVDSLANTYGLDMVLWGKNTQHESLRLPQEKELFNAYQYALEKGLRMESNLQKSGDSVFLFTRTLPGLAQVCWGDSANGMSVVRLKIPKAAVVKSLPFRKK